MDAQTALKLWHEGNEAAEGFAPKALTMMDQEALEEEFGPLWFSTGPSDQDIEVFRSATGTIVGVGDANGPWAVRLN